MRAPESTTAAVKVSGVSLMPPSLLVRTGPVDHADWNYSGLLGAIQRQRFRLVAQLLGAARFDALLEIGYGSGVFAPELAKHCARYHGLDIHDRVDAVADALRSVGVEAVLRQGSATEIPFPDKSFDCVVGVSVIEFVDDQRGACSEIRRVLKDDGMVVLVTPGHGPLLDLGLLLFTGESARADYGDRRERVLESLKEQFEVVRQRDFPSPSMLDIYLYRALQLRKRRVAPS